MHPRLVLAAACLSATGLLLAQPAAHADGSSGAGAPRPAAAARATAVTLGQVATTGAAQCTPGPSVMAQYLEAGPPSYVAPTAGVLTSYSVRAGATAGSARLVVLGPSPTPDHRTVVGLSALNPVVINTVNTFPTRVPIAAGQSIGLNNSAAPMICWGAGAAGDQVRASVFDPAVITDFTSFLTVPNMRVNISAVLEPDVDGDQFGDVTQDLCPESRLTQAACPAPDTKVTKKPKKRSASRKARIRFTSTVAGSTFTCAVDGRAARPCTSPFKKRFKVGKHIVVITATSAVGIADPTPVAVRFKVTRPRR